MANGGGMLGYVLGIPEHRRERKEMLSDEARQVAVNDLFAQRKRITDTLGDKQGDDLKAAQGALDSIHGQLDKIYHPDHNPGALQKDWHWLSGLIHKHRAVPPVLSTASQPGAAIAATPDEKLSGMPGQDITLPSTTPMVQLDPSSGGTYDVGPMAGKIVPDMLKTGNTDVNHRVQINNADGSGSSIFSVTVPFDKNEKAIPWQMHGKPNPSIVSYALIPGMDVNGRFFTPDGNKPAKMDGQFEDRAAAYYNQTGGHLGVFKTADAANRYAGQTHAWTNDGTDRKVFTPSYTGEGNQGQPQAPVPVAPATASTGPQDVTLAATPATNAPMTTTVSANPAAMTPQQRQGMARQERVRTATALDMAGAGLTPEQAARAKSSQQWAYIRQGVKDWREANPAGTPEEEAQFFNDLTGSVLQLKEKPSLKLYELPDGTKAWLDANRPDLIRATGATAIEAGNADTRARADFEAYRGQHPEYKGTFEQWKAEQSQLGKMAAPTNRDDRYLAIEQKRQLGQPLSQDDQAYAAAWDIYINKRVVEPGVARAAAFGAMRYVQVVDPTDPEKVVFMRAGDASRAGAGTPASIAFQTDKAMARFMTVGQGGQNLNYFNTAVDHLKLLSETADALNNGNYPLVNQWANAYETATGDPAPTNFNAVKNAVSGELSKVFKGTGATNEEIALMNQTINNAMSPAEIAGAVHYYVRLMDGKIHGLRLQYQAGKTGQPAFPETPAAPGAPVKSKGLVSIAKAKTKPTYQGMSDDQIRMAIMKQGYTPIP